ncbi:response regulator [Desulfolucanica intricata]|uniref:response regulator n=1 Tax=Desulfolucanica intricata TaxID=1285191 RepID=UPI000831F731|nr:response regulator [Desulfolucanica intricata]
MGSCELMIVDDQAGVRRLLYEVFCDEGYRVDLAASGPEALKKAAQLRPEIILLDMKMPGMNGLETLKELKKVACEATVVMMTAYSELDFVMQARELGVKHYINKPFDIDDIRSLIKGLMPVQGQVDKYLQVMG